MQVIDDEAKPSPGQAPEAPVQVSATSHCPAEARQTVALDWKTSTHALLVPVQWSAASLSHAPPCEAPVQLAALEANPFAGQAPEVPVQLSATSHCPEEARQTVALDWKASMHESLVPAQ